MWTRKLHTMLQRLISVTWLHFISFHSILKCSAQPKWVNCSGHYVQLVDCCESINLREKFYSTQSPYSMAGPVIITCYLYWILLEIISINIDGPSAIFKLRRLIKLIKIHSPNSEQNRHTQASKQTNEQMIDKQTCQYALSVHAHTQCDKITSLS